MNFGKEKMSLDYHDISVDLKDHSSRGLKKTNLNNDLHDLLEISPKVKSRRLRRQSIKGGVAGGGPLV